VATKPVPPIAKVEFGSILTLVAVGDVMLFNDVIVPAVVAAAFAGITDNRPRLSAETATSAMRLIDVFVDIIFLSIVEFGTIPISALR